MDALISSLQSKTLRHTDVPEKYQLYRAALEWDLIDPIVIEKKDDIKSEKHWKDKVNPYNHQVSNLITFCRRLPVTLLADDVGLGKTISAGLVISELISRGRLSKILIVCPKILREQWKEELDTKFGISAVVATGKELTKAEPPGGVGAVITTYRSATLYLDSLKNSGFDMLILDEAHKLRNLHGTDKSPQVARQFKEVLKERQFKYVLMLTATPIHNRLWDLYSLVDLLSIARGHENPFGAPGMFARRFIADKSSEARNLIPEMQEEFRSIVYGYMSRVRRDDAGLHFPQREVQLHMVQPTEAELELVSLVGQSIQGMNRLAQISILQALVSSPEALAKQLAAMARNETVPKSFAKEVNEAVKGIKNTAKLNGLGALIDKLRAEQPKDWRVVVFTTRKETQTTIQDFLHKRGIKSGLINGSSGATNQEMLNGFKADKPKVHVIVSTEAGSEGVNMQSANVLVNYDLPWNPMIVEQRIGRVQRLGSKYDKVCIFNIVLKGTFEEYIVGRLMEKLQMASHAIGDIESLLQASGMGEGEDDESSDTFEDKILKLVLASLTGKDVKAALAKEEKSISEAKAQLETQEREIDSMLGDMDSSGADTGPKSPKLPATIYSMNARDFVLSALKELGADVKRAKDGLYECRFVDRQELIRFESEPIEGTLSTLYAPGTSAFDKLVRKIIIAELHRVQDSDTSILVKAEDITTSWVSSFGGKLAQHSITEVDRCFSGTALLRVRATVAHDSYERLVEVLCTPDEHQVNVGKSNISEIDKVIDKPESVGIDSDLLIEKSKLDAGISEFCRFYRERLSFELSSVGEDERKAKKIEDDFTPRLSYSLVGLEGFVARDLEIDVEFHVGSEFKYSSHIRITPSTGEIWSAPKIAQCEFTHMSVPETCLKKCDISELKVLEHLLVTSEISKRRALSEYIVECDLTGKKVLRDEVEKSDVSNKLVISSLLKTSALSGRRAEPKFITKCDFTGSEILESESAISDISGKRYRIDEELSSAVSGKKGHKTEFIYCAETKQPLCASEAETCEITKKQVMPGILEICEISGKKALPSKLETSSISGRKALKEYFVSSSVSNARLLKEEAVKSATGKFCLPVEAKKCVWSRRLCHVDDLKVCALTNLAFHFEFIKEKNGQSRLEILSDLLDEIQRGFDVEVSETMKANLASVVRYKTCDIESNRSNPDKSVVAVCFSGKSFLGLRTIHFGALYSTDTLSVIGKVAEGNRSNRGWMTSRTA